MGSKDFHRLCINAVVGYYNSRAEVTDHKHITEDDVYIVWSCKTLQNNKALLSASVYDGMYYEITHNGDKGEMYLDAYKKWENVVISVKEDEKNGSES